MHPEHIETFTVYFPGRAGGPVHPLLRKYYGWAKIAITPAGILITGKTRRPFWFGKPEELLIAASRIYNARLRVRMVLFDLRGEDGFHPFALGTRKLTVAQEILNRLPENRTPEFAREMNEVNRFKEHVGVSEFAPVTIAVVAINVAVFVLMSVKGVNLLKPDGKEVVGWGSNFGLLTLNGQWWRLFTSMFVHFGVFHLLFNMVALYATGRTVEKLYGSTRYAIIYIFSGLAGSVVSLLIHPFHNSAGASGAIFGVLGALLAFVLDGKNGVPSSIMKQHRQSTIAFILFNLFNGFTHNGIDNGAHIGGLVGGLVMGYFIAKPVGAKQSMPDNLREIAFAIVGGITLLLAAAYPLYGGSGKIQGDMAFLGVLEKIEVPEHRAVTDFKALIADKPTEENKLAKAQTVEDKILPQWDVAMAQVSSVSLDPASRFVESQRLMLAYIQTRREAMAVFATILRSNDEHEQEQLLLKAKQLTQQSNSEVQEFKAAEEKALHE